MQTKGRICMKHMKKALAFLFVLIIISTSIPVSTTYAAAKKPAFSTKKITLEVGKTKTLKVKNIDKKAALKWSSKKKSVATVSKKGVVKAVKAGTTKISCKITTKNKKKYTLTCTVKVKKPTAKNVSKTVSTQKELETALKTKNLTKLTIQTEDEITFTIPEGSYNKVALTVDAPKADIVNFGKFKSINIKAIKADTWKENASGNTIKITAIDARIVVEAGAALANVSVTQDGGKIKIEAAGTIDTIEISAPIIVDLVVDGKVGEVAVKAAAVVSVEGNTTEAVPIKVSEAAAGTTLSSSTPVEVEAASDISLTLAKGAEGSKVEVTGETTEIAVKNDTTEAVKVTTPAGTQEVAKDTSSKVNTDGSISGTTTTNPGYIYPSSDPLAMSTIMVKSTTEIAVYFNQTVPAGIAVENIKIKNADGGVQNIKKVIRHSLDTQAYFIEFSDALATGTYTVTMAVSGKQFEGTFEYDASVWEPLDAAKRIVIALMESGLTVSSSGLQSNEICRQAFEKELEEKIKVDSKASAIDKLSVQTRPFKYEESYPAAEPVLQPDKMVSIWVGGYKGDANFMWNAFVKFTCTGEAIVVSEPKVNEMKLKNSIVVQYEQGYEYACAKEGVAYEDIPDDAWISHADNMGNCELKDLETNAAYIVYKRMVDAPELYATAKVTLTADAPEIICVASASRTTYEAGTVTSGSAITFSVPTGIVTGNYGNITQNEELCGMLTMDEKAINGSNWRIKDQNLIVTLPWDEEKFNKGTIILKYTYRCIDRESGISVAESAPIEFTINFTVK